MQQIAGPEGIFTICALDHRGSFRNMINRENPQAVTYDEMVSRKMELCSTLGPHASALLIDPLFGAAQCISLGILPRTTGLLVSTEATGYEGGKEHRVTTLLEGWGVEKIKRMGASAAKILVYYRPDIQPLAGEQLKTVNAVAEDCIKYDLPFLVEPVSYTVGNEADNPAEFARKLHEDRAAMREFSNPRRDEYYAWWQSRGPFHCSELREMYAGSDEFLRMGQRAVAKLEELIAPAR